MDISPEQRDLLARARLRAIRARPYYAAVLLALRPLPVTSLGSVAVDSRANLYIDFEAFEGWSEDQRVGALVHEASHVLRNHLGRARHRGTAVDRKRWNLACDAEINDDLDLALPDNVVTPERLGCDPHHLAEHYYAHLGGTRPPALPSPDCGSCVDGVRRGYETTSGTGLEPSDLDAIRRQVADAIHDAPPGTIPAGEQRWADALTAPTQDWASLLRNLIGRTGRRPGTTHWTYRRPSRRRRPGSGVLLPATYTPEHRIALVVDTSGSMTQNELNVVATEAAVICRSIPGVQVRLFSCDADATDEGELRPGQPLPLTGGGGTDLRVGIDAALEMRPKPTVIIVATDGHTPWPDTAPSGPMLIALLVRDQAPDPPPWVRVAHHERATPSPAPAD